MKLNTKSAELLFLCRFCVIMEIIKIELYEEKHTNVRLSTKNV